MYLRTRGRILTSSWKVWTSTTTREPVWHSTGQTASERALGTGQCLGSEVAVEKQYRLPVVYGAVTNGIKWQFFTFTPREDGVGGIHRRSVLDASWSSAMRAALSGVLNNMILVLRPMLCTGSPMECQ
ncbi:hypothetical protein C8Q76DRAFT_689415 [Earliella scabrosa]|nr:hypothetical protein C8Q76DRAFT_689415 [Earliella scabrosa]